MAPSKICSVEGCGNKHWGLGFCKVHCLRFKRHGDPLVAKRVPNGELQRWLEFHQSFEGPECLIWPFKSRTRYGYGMTEFRGRKTTAHRAMCILVHGDPPQRKLHAAHNCSNGSNGCVHPHHLRWATPKENAADKVEQGTANRGRNNPLAKLTEEQVREVRDLSARERPFVIAKRFGVTNECIYDILKGKRWAWLE